MRVCTCVYECDRGNGHDDDGDGGELVTLHMATIAVVVQRKNGGRHRRREKLGSRTRTAE